MEDTIRLVVAADDPLARAGLAAILATLPDCLVVAQGGGELAAEVAAGLADALDTPADVVVWDMGREPSEERADAEERLGGGAPVLALVGDEEAAALAWQLGCRGVLPRRADADQLAAAVTALAAGLVVLAPGLAAALSADAQAADAAISDLTPRELEVLWLVAEGLTNKAIAQRLAISDHTVKFHVNAILGKLGAQSRTDAVVRATRLGLIAL